MSTIKVAGKEFDPDDPTQFAIVEGRYYSFMYFIDLPKDLSKFGKGGNINGMVWRKDSNPEEWFLQFRFRHYKDKAVWDSDDEKSWFMAILKGKTEEVCRKEVDRLLTASLMTALEFGHTEPFVIHYMEIHGGPDKFHDVVHSNPPFWMHMQQMVTE